MIFIVLNETLFQAYSVKEYPNEMDNYSEPDQFPNYDNALYPNARQSLRDGNAFDNMVHFNVKHMNAALIARFLLFLGDTYQEQWKHHCLNNGTANPIYLQCWQFFLDKYCALTSTNRTKNLNNMKTPWNPATGFEALVRQIQDDIEYAPYACQPLDGDDVVDIVEQIILQSIQYPDIYEEWQAEPNHSWNKFRSVWCAKQRLHKQTGQCAASFGFGGKKWGQQRFGWR